LAYYPFQLKAILGNMAIHYPSGIREQGNRPHFGKEIQIEIDSVRAGQMS